MNITKFFQVWMSNLGRFSTMRITNQMGVKIIHVRALDTTAVAPPGVVLIVEPLVQEVQSLIGEGDVAVLALPVGITVVAILYPVLVDFLHNSHWAG